jgi:hypothetical protein
MELPMADDIKSNRFQGASDVIDMEKLKKKTRKLLILGLLVAVSFHIALGSYFMFKKTEVNVVKLPTIEFVIYRPRTTKPFEFKKKHIQQHEYKKNEIVQRKPTVESKSKSLQETMIGNVASYEFDTEMNIDTGGKVFIPDVVSIELSVERELGKQISMKEEMISLDDLDTGQYKAMIIQDPEDKKSVTGFIYIATLWGAQLEPAYKRAVIHLSDAVNRYTNIKSKVDKHLFLDSKRLFDTPFVFLCADEQFELTTAESKNFGEYLRKGGFAVLDNGNPTLEFGAAEASLRKMFKDALGPDAKFLPIPNSHPLYHCFEDFDDGPPQSDEIGMVQVLEVLIVNPVIKFLKKTMSKQVLYLEGIWIDDRLVAIYSDKGYARKWEETSNNEPQLKMGVNMVVYALTQEGSVAQQKMDFFSTAN